MNVSGLKRAVLRNINEKDDEQSLMELGDEILSYINEGYLNAMITKVRPVKRIECQSENRRIPIKELGDEFIEVNRLIDKYGMDVRYSRNDEYIFADDGSYEVEYFYLPSALDSDEDVPAFGSAFHYILSDYAAYRMFLKGSKARQSRGDAFLSSYLNGLSKLGSGRNHRIRNKYGSDVNG